MPQLGPSCQSRCGSGAPAAADWQASAADLAGGRAAGLRHPRSSLPASPRPAVLASHLACLPTITPLPARPRSPSCAAGSPSARCWRSRMSTRSSCAARGPPLSGLPPSPSPSRWRVRAPGAGQRSKLASRTTVLGAGSNPFVANVIGSSQGSRAAWLLSGIGHWTECPDTLLPPS